VTLERGLVDPARVDVEQARVADRAERLDAEAAGLLTRENSPPAVARLQRPGAERPRFIGVLPSPAMAPLPLSGVTVLELAMNLAGPFAGETLARLGADVVKVERPEGGDDARGWGPPFLAGAGSVFHNVNGGKRSIALDLKNPSDVAWLKEHVKSVDVVLQNMRPGSLDELGLGPEALCAINPRLIYCSLSAFGPVGPNKDRPGYEPMMQAFAGLFWTSGAEDSPPFRIGVPTLDVGSGMWAVIGILAALVRRTHTGVGGVVDTSLFETALTWLGGTIASYGIAGEVPKRHPTGSVRLVPFEGFRTKTGMIVVAAANDRLFATLATTLGHPEWAGDPRFRTNADRQAHKHILLADIEAVLTTRPAAEWLEVLEQAGIPCAPINTLPDVLAERQTAASGILQRVPGHDLEIVALPLRFEGERPPLPGPTPGLGEHTKEIRGSA
jgi:crotonobetainyl-CoA:carnitine CoA-transferase CaiB-like acyl-CoA transferase